MFMSVRVSILILMIFRLDLGTVLTVWYFRTVLTVWYFRTVQTVWYFFVCFSFYCNFGVITIKSTFSFEYFGEFVRNR